jgi:hypothetical protein
MKMGRPKKEFHEYLVEPNGCHVVHEDYSRSPASAFLRYTIEAKDAVNYCQNHFPKNADGAYRKDAIDSLQYIVSAFLPAIMGHFETFERYLFAGVFEHSRLLRGFDVEKFFSSLKKEYNVSIDAVRLGAYRGFRAPVGILLADNLPGWHDPERVNAYFRAFGFRRQFFSNDDCARLRVLWQLRHSIVYTGGSITIPDAQKVDELKDFGGKPVVFGVQFIFELSRRMHPLVKTATKGIEGCFRSDLIDNVPKHDQESLAKLFEVKSSVSAWLR